MNETVKITVYMEDEQQKHKIDKKTEQLIKDALNATLEYEEFFDECTVSVTFTDNEGIKKLNEEYRGIASATDVLSFPLNDFENDEFFEGEVIELGDIIISVERAIEQAELYGHGCEREIAFLCVHSMLHLLGYDHETGDEDEKDMRVRQREIMKRLGLEVHGNVK